MNHERKDARALLEFLDAEQQLDLSKHLYSTHLIHRRSSSRFPVARWTNWPLNPLVPRTPDGDPFKPSTSVGSSSVPIPRIDEVYTDVDDPRRSVLDVGELPGPDIILKRGHPGEPIDGDESDKDDFDKDDSDKDVSDGDSDDFDGLDDASLISEKLMRKNLLAARQMLLFEINSRFQRMVHERIQASGSELSIEPVPALGPNAQRKILDVLHAVLERLSHRRYGHFVKNSPVTWIDVVGSNASLGDVSSRCERLFIKTAETDGIDRAVVPYSAVDYMDMNLATNVSSLAAVGGRNRTADLPANARTFEPVPSNDELLLSNLIDVSMPEDYEPVVQSIVKAEKRRQRDITRSQNAPAPIMLFHSTWDPDQGLSGSVMSRKASRDRKRARQSQE